MVHSFTEQNCKNLKIVATKMAKGGGRPRPASHTLGFSFAEDPDLDPKAIGRKEVKAVYRMNLQSHTFPNTNCKKNCKLNPRCLVGLGERVWMEIDDEDDSDIEIEDEMLRIEGEITYHESKIVPYCYAL